MIFQGKDGELRINDHGLNGTTHYLEVLFCEMNFTGPTARPKTEETLIMNRGKMDTDAHYIDGDDAPIYAPIPISFSCRLADTSASTVALDWFSGVTTIRTKVLYSRDGNAVWLGNTLPAFRDSSKQAYTIELLWDGTQDIGYQYDCVYFPPSEQTITESGDNLILSINGQVYGGVTRITAFNSGAMTDLVTA